MVLAPSFRKVLLLVTAKVNPDKGKTINLKCQTLESEQELLIFVEHINSKVDSLKFTLEQSTESVPFLDVRILQDSEGNLSTDLFKKETDARNYLQFSSAHPLSVKRAIPYGQFLRIRRVCSTLDLYDTNAIQMARDFRRRGFPEETITNALIKARRCDRDTLLAPKVIDATKTSVTSDDIFCVQTYTPGQPILADIIKTNIPFLNRNPKFRAFQALKCKNAYRRPKNLSDFLVKATITPDTPKPNPTHQRRGRSLTLFQRMAQSATNLGNPKVTPTLPVTSLCNSQSQAKLPRNLPTKCVSSTCRYCYRIDKSGRIKSAFTKREYVSKIHVDCRSSNLIYCLQCDTCLSQYVGQTKRQLRDRLSEHLRSIRSNPTASIIAHHVHHDESDPTGVNLRVFVIDFISSNPHSDVAKQCRLDAENKWIHRLRTLFPQGFNHLE